MWLQQSRFRYHNVVAWYLLIDCHSNRNWCLTSNNYCSNNKWTSTIKNIVETTGLLFSDCTWSFFSSPAIEILPCALYFQGDSGSPLTSTDGVIGVNSFGLQKCGIEHPDVFTRVYPYVQWIKDVIRRTP